MIHPVKGFSIVSEAEADVFLELSSFFYGPIDADNLICCSSAFSNLSLYIWKFSVHILLKPSLKDFEPYFASLWNECSCAIVWTFIDIALLWDWNENWHFPILRPLLSFPNLLAYWVQNINSIVKSSSFREDYLTNFWQMDWEEKSPVSFSSQSIKGLMHELLAHLILPYKWWTWSSQALEGAVTR